MLNVDQVTLSAVQATLRYFLFTFTRQESRPDASRYYDLPEMMLQRAYTQRTAGVFFNAFLVGMVMLLICEHITKADEVPAFFLKIARIPTLPRVGRSGGRHEDFFYKAEKHIPRIGRSSQDEEETYADLAKRRIDYPSTAEESWQNFPLAIEGPKELWKALAGYSRDASDDIENEVWQRKKRTESDWITTQEK